MHAFEESMSEYGVKGSCQVKGDLYSTHHSFGDRAFELLMYSAAVGTTLGSNLSTMIEHST